MCAHTSVSSFSTRQSALLAKPTLRPTARRPAAFRRRTSSASTAYAVVRSRPPSRAEGGTAIIRPSAYAAASSSARLTGVRPCSDPNVFATLLCRNCHVEVHRPLRRRRRAQAERQRRGDQRQRRASVELGRPRAEALVKQRS